MRRNTMSTPREYQRLWRWDALGVLAGALVALLIFAGMVALREPERLRVSYSSPPVRFGPAWDLWHRVAMEQQPSTLRGVRSLGGETVLTLTTVLDSGDTWSEEFVDLNGLELVLSAVDGESGERETLRALPDSATRLENLSGAMRPGEPFWLRFEYTPPERDADSYEAYLRLGDLERTAVLTEEESR